MASVSSIQVKRRDRNPTVRCRDTGPASPTRRTPAPRHPRGPSGAFEPGRGGGPCRHRIGRLPVTGHLSAPASISGRRAGSRRTFLHRTLLRISRTDRYTGHADSDGDVIQRHPRRGHGPRGWPAGTCSPGSRWICRSAWPTRPGTGHSLSAPRIRARPDTVIPAAPPRRRGPGTGLPMVAKWSRPGCSQRCPGAAPPACPAPRRTRLYERTAEAGSGCCSSATCPCRTGERLVLPRMFSVGRRCLMGVGRQGAGLAGPYRADRDGPLGAQPAG